MKLKFLKTTFSKIHIAAVVFVVINLLTGASMNLGIYHGIFHTLHFYTGFSIIAAPLIVFLFLRNKKAAATSFVRLVTLNANDFRRKNYFNIFTKITANILIIQVFIFTVTGLTMKFIILENPGLALIAYNIHVINFRTILLVLAAHITTAILKRKMQNRAVDKNI